MRVNIFEILRSRAYCQGFLANYPNRRIEKLLDQAWFLVHKYSINSRLPYNFKQALSAIKKNAVELFLLKQRVYVSFHTFGLLYLRSQEFDIENHDLTELLGQNGHLVEADLKKKLKTPGISKIINPYLKSFQLIIVHRERRKEYWQPSAFYQFLLSQNILSPTDDHLEQIVLKIISNYPYLNLDQIAALSGVSKFDLGRPVHKLMTKKMIERSSTEYPGERYIPSNFKMAEPRSSYPTFVVDAKDPFLQLIKYGKEIELPKNQYYLFTNSLLQCGFDLKKMGNSYLIINFSPHDLTTEVQDTLLNEIINWGRTQFLNLTYDQKSSPQGAVASRFITLLLERGYSQNPRGLYMHSTNERRGKLSLQDVNRMILSRKYESVESFLNSVIQVESFESIKIRFSLPFVNISDFVQTYGIGGRFALMSQSSAKMIIHSEKTEFSRSLINEMILRIIEEGVLLKTEEILQKIESPHNKVLNAIRYLERHHLIQRLPSTELDIHKQIWQIWKKENDIDCETSQIWLLKTLLENSPPLTTLQITRYLGWPLPVIDLLLKSIVKSGEILEGYFLEGVQDIQFTVKRSTMQFDEIRGIEFYPSSEPFALVLPEMIQTHPELKPSEGISSTQEIFFLLENFRPIGYFVLDESEIEYTLRIYLLDEDLNLLIPTLEKINAYTQFRFQKNGRILSINNDKVRDSKYERFHFGIELLGFKI